MKRIHSSLIRLLLAAALALPPAGCGNSQHARGYMNFDGGGISLKNGTVVIKVKRREPAHVGGDGRLSIGDREVAVSPQAQAALGRYNAAALGFTDDAVNLGLEGADFALRSIGQVFSGMLQGTTDQASRQAEQGSHAIEAKAKALCQRLQEWRLAQDAAAAAAPEFRPYAVIKTHDTDDCSVNDRAPEKPAAQQQISS